MYLAREAMLKRIGRLDALGPGVHFVYLHHIFADEVGPFRELLRRLSKQAVFLSHSDAVQKVTSGAIDRAYISFSFDDGLLNCLDSARILEEFGVRGCYFVCPAAVDHCHDHAWIARWCHERLHKTPAQVMTWNDLEELQRRGHEIGNHTMHHSNLAETPQASRPEEISFARDQLVRRLGAAAGHHFAWPYGETRHIDPAAVRDIMAAGHTSCSSAVRGVHVPGPPSTSPPILLRNHAVFVRPVGATEFFMRRNICNRMTEFRHQQQDGGN
ncbi:MAG: polysaccharide deacetylase family protein [bacterium]